MPVEAKPLFRPDVLRPHLSAFQLPPVDTSRLKHWANSDAFVEEVRRIRGKRNALSAAALKSLREEYASTIEPARKLAAEAVQLERQVSDLVNQAYGLTPEEVSLMWKTAPPRMPLMPL